MPKILVLICLATALGGCFSQLEVSCLDNLALQYYGQGQYAKAEPLYQRALAISEQAHGPAHPEVARSLVNLAMLYRDQGQYAKAEPLYQRALAIQEQEHGPKSPEVAGTLIHLALLYGAQGQYTKAEPLYQRALAISEQANGPEDPMVATTLNNLGMLYRDQGQYAKAEPLFERALAISEQDDGPESPNVAWSLSNLAGLKWAQGELHQALVLLRRANTVREHNLARELAAGSEARKQAYMSLVSGETSTTLAFHLSAAPQDPEAVRLALTTVLQRKGRVLEVMTEGVAALRQRLDPADQPLFDQLMERRTQLAALLVKGPGEQAPGAYRSQAARLEKEAEALEARISARSAEFRALSQTVTLEEVQRAIPADAALFELAAYRAVDPRAQPTIEGPQRYAVYVLLPQGEPRWADLGEAGPINGAVNAFRAAIEARLKAARRLTRAARSETVLQAARALDEQLLRPLRPLVGSARHLLIAPDGALNLLPFGALVDEEGHYLIERYKVSYLGSGRDLLRLKVVARPRAGAMIFADPDFDRQEISPIRTEALSVRGNRRSRDLGAVVFGPLPGTAEEARALHAVLPDSQVFSGQQASEGLLKGLRGPRLLHLATHGFFLPDEPKPLAVLGEPTTGSPAPHFEHPLLRSGLVLAGANERASQGEDGVLTALEASGLDLWGTELVALSACDTGLGKVENGEGVYGLRRAMVMAGARSQIMTLWSVEDEATRDLMVEFYRHLSAGEGRAEALREIQLKFLASPDLSHPYFWAGFILSGDWEPLGN